MSPFSSGFFGTVVPLVLALAGAACILEGAIILKTRSYGASPLIRQQIVGWRAAAVGGILVIIGVACAFSAIAIVAGGLLLR